MHTCNIKDTTSASPSSGKLDFLNCRGTIGCGCTAKQALMQIKDKNNDDFSHVNTDYQF